MRVLLLKNLTDRLGRKYKKEELLYNLMKLDGPLYGEFGFEKSSSIDLSSVSHSISDIRFEGDDLYGDLKVATTQVGLVIAEILEHCPDKVRIGMRATGHVDKDNCVSDLRLITFDVYLDSVSEAIVKTSTQPYN